MTLTSALQSNLEKVKSVKRWLVSGLRHIQEDRGNEIVEMLLVMVIICMALLPNLLSMPQKLETWFDQGLVQHYTSLQ